MKTQLLATALAAATLAGCATYGDRDRYRDDWGYYDQRSYSSYGSYDYDRPDPRYGGYYPERYYRSDRRYGQRRLSYDDRVYRGRNDQYYCRRSDGTTGLIVGAIAGGVLGNIIAEGRSETVGTIIGALGGAAIGASIDSRGRRDRNVYCR